MRLDLAVLEQVLRLLESGDGASRNRNHAAFQGPEGERVHRLYRLYLSLAHELDEAQSRPEVAVSADDQDNGALRLELSDPRVSYRRICLVPAALAGHFRRRLGRTA